MTATAPMAERRGRSSYDGFRAVLKAVGTGPRGSRALTFDEARCATAALLADAVTPAQAGAFLLAMRIKGETPEELAGIARALRDARRPLTAPPGPPLVACAGAYDGMGDGPPLSLAAAVLAAAAGARIVVHCGNRLGPKRGVTPAEVLAALGGPARPSAEDSLAMLARARVTLVHAADALPGWERLAVLRDEIGLRGPLHTAEKLVDHLGATRFVVGYTHSSYADRILGALRLLGADSAVAIRGLEGSDVVRPARPVAHVQSGPLELPPGPREALPSAASAPDAAALTRAVCVGAADGASTTAALLSAGLRVYAAGLCDDPREGASRAAAAVADGRAEATLQALVG